MVPSLSVVYVEGLTSVKIVHTLLETVAESKSNLLIDRGVDLVGKVMTWEG